MKKWKIVGTILAVIGVAVDLVSGFVDDKNLEDEINEAVNKRFEELTNADENDDNEE